MVTVAHQKCACADGVCIVEIKDAVKRDDRHYRSEACASSHPSGAGRDHTGCACAG